MVKSFDWAAAEVKYFTNSGELAAPVSIAFKRHVRLRKFFSFTTTLLGMIIELESADTLAKTDTEPDADTKRPHIMFRKTKMITTMFPLNEWLQDIEQDGAPLPDLKAYLKTANLEPAVSRSFSVKEWKDT